MDFFAGAGAISGVPDGAAIGSEVGGVGELAAGVSVGAAGGIVGASAAGGIWSLLGSMSYSP